MVTSPMLATAILKDAFGRVHDGLQRALDGLEPDALLWQPDPAANSIGWIAWHLARVQDDHLAGVAAGDPAREPAQDQVWLAQAFAARFALPYPELATGYGQTAEQVSAFTVAGTAPLLEYHDAVHRQTLEILQRMDQAAYDRIVDRRWNPPVTAAVRLVSVVGDTMQHLGQIGYIAGLYQRR